MYSIITALLGLAAIGETAIVRPRIQARDTKCYSGVYIIYARGTFEPQNASLSNVVANSIVAAIPDSFSIQVEYPANVSAVSPGIGVEDTKKQVTDYYNACPCSKMVLMGYSQGALVVGNAIAGGNASTIIPQSIGKNIISVVMFGDPNRVLGQGVDNEPGSCNVSSAAPRTDAKYDEMSFYADRLDEYCAAGDPVCCSTGNDYSAHLSYFNDENKAAIAQYVSDKYSSSVICGSASASVKASSTVSRSSAKSASMSSVKSASASASVSKVASSGKPMSSASLSGSTSTSRVKSSVCPVKTGSSSGKLASTSVPASSAKASSAPVKSSTPQSAASSSMKTSAVVSGSSAVSKSSISGSAQSTPSSPVKTSGSATKASSTTAASSTKLVTSTTSSKKPSSTATWPVPQPTGYGWGGSSGGWFNQVFGGFGW